MSHSTKNSNSKLTSTAKHLIALAFIASLAGFNQRTHAQSTGGTTKTTVKFAYQIGVAEGWKANIDADHEIDLIPEDLIEGLESFQLNHLESEFASFESEEVKAAIKLKMDDISATSIEKADFKHVYENSDKTFRVLVYFWNSADGQEMATDFYLFQHGSRIVYSQATTLVESRNRRSHYIMAMMESLTFDE